MNQQNKYIDKYRPDVVIYVSNNSDIDICDGSFEKPFKTISQAISHLTKKSYCEKTVMIYILSGTYYEGNININEEIVCKKIYIVGDNCEINNGLRLTKNDFTNDIGEYKHIFPLSIQNKIVACNLNEYRIKREDYVKISPHCFFQQTKYSPDEYMDVNCELFENDMRLSLARYPKNENTKVKSIIEKGSIPANEFGIKKDDDLSKVGIYEIDDDIADRMKNYSSDDIWVNGFFAYDWADSSTKVKINNNTISLEHEPRFGVKEGGEFYFFNIPEELNTEGEWYLDRKTGILYLYPLDDNFDICFSYKRENIINILRDNITLDGITFSYTLWNAINIKANDCHITNCTFKCIYDDAIFGIGNNICIDECTLYNLGRGGINLIGGDRKTLTLSHDVVKKCIIHDFQEVSRVYFPGIRFTGCGFECSFNEIYSSSHSAIQYTGNEIDIAYNYIHDVCTITSDAGAIYAGRDWSTQGCRIKYNRIENIGAGKYRPSAIYWDDGLSGQTAEYNFIRNVKDNAILAGGGRDNIIRKNIIINCGEPIQYDERYYQAIRGSKFGNLVKDIHDVMWVRLFDMPYTSEVWRKHYPTLQKIKTDYSQMSDIDFPCNPSYSVIEDNYIFCTSEQKIRIDDSVYKYSKVGKNVIFDLNLIDGFCDDLEKINDFIEKYK